MLQADPQSAGHIRRSHHHSGLHVPVLRESWYVVQGLGFREFLFSNHNDLFPADLPNTVQRAATHIARKAVEMDIVPGRSPISVAAAAIYMASQASDQKKTHKEIGDIAGVADVTIRQSYRLMHPHAAELFPEDFKFTTPIDQLPQM